MQLLPRCRVGGNDGRLTTTTIRARLPLRCTVLYHSRTDRSILGRAATCDGLSPWLPVLTGCQQAHRLARTHTHTHSLTLTHGRTTPGSMPVVSLCKLSAVCCQNYQNYQDGGQKQEQASSVSLFQRSSHGRESCRLVCAQHLCFVVVFFYFTRYYYLFWRMSVFLHPRNI